MTPVPVAVVALTLAAVAWAPPTARADATAGDGGSTVSVGVSTGGTSPGGSGSGGSGGRSGGGSSDPCIYSQLPPVVQTSLGVGGAEPGSWYTKVCPSGGGGDIGSVIWVSTAAPAAPAVDPATVAAQAAASLHLPAPAPGFNPDRGAVVNLPVWFWIDSSVWHNFSVTATVGGVSATATATPVSVDWWLGDGTTTVCDGPGVEYRADEPAADQETYCSHTFSQSSAGQPSPDGDPDDGSFGVVVVVNWAVTWTATGAAGGGSLPGLTTSAATSLRVAQIQSVVTPDALRTLIPGGPIPLSGEEAKR